MKGVLLKDLYIAKSSIIITLTCLFVLTFGLSFLLDVSSVLLLAPAISTVAVYISITNDASSKWNKNVVTMPVSREQITRTLYDEDGYPHLCVDEYMKRCLKIRLIQAIVKV